jgi:putative protein-disulfide isomerase
MKLIFAGDPMCSWCYGFGKELSTLMERHPELPLQILVGGVRAGATDLLDDAGKQFRLAHWARVEANSGLPFNRAGFMARQNFVYDTEPVCRAVVAARRLAPEGDMLQVFRALQTAFYADALDTTDGRVLSEVVAKALHIDAGSVHQAWLAQDTIAATTADFRYARELGVRSFPTLLLETPAGMAVVSPGYAKVEEMDRSLNALVARYGSANAA